MIEHHGFLISSPEYNSSISGVLKNAIDWTSRPRDNEPPYACYAKKVIGLMSASTGGLGGLRGLVHVRAILDNMNAFVIPNQIAISKAHEAFNQDDSLKNSDKEIQVKKIGSKVEQIISKLNS